jgi:hypothetical protein
VVFTGIYGYAIAVAWLILGLLLLVFICCKCLCGKRARSKRPHSRAYYWAPRIIVFLFSAIAMYVFSSTLLKLTSLLGARQNNYLEWNHLIGFKAMCAQGELVVAIFFPDSFNGAQARQCVKLKISIRHS